MHGKLSCCQITRRMRIKKFNRCPIPHLGDFFIPPHQCPAPPRKHSLHRWSARDNLMPTAPGPRANPVCVGGTWAGGVSRPARRGVGLSPEALAKDDLSPEALAKGGLSRVTSHELRVTIKTGYPYIRWWVQPNCCNTYCQRTAILSDYTVATLHIFHIPKNPY